MLMHRRRKNAPFVKNLQVTFCLSDVMSTHGHWMHRRSAVDFFTNGAFFHRLLMHFEIVHHTLLATRLGGEDSPTENTRCMRAI